MADLVVKSVLKNIAREKSYVDFGGVRILMNSTVCELGIELLPFFSCYPETRDRKSVFL